MSVEVKEYLSRVYKANKLIESDIRELEKLHNLSSNISVSMQNSVESENILSKITKLENEINTEICNLIDTKEEVKMAIDTVGDFNQNMLLRLVYLDFKSIEEAAELMHYSVRHMHRLHKLALGNVKGLES